MKLRTPAWLVPCAAAALTAGIALGRGAETALPGLAALAMAGAAALLLRGNLRRAAAMAAVLALGFALGQRAYHPALPPEGECRVSGVICSEVRQRADGQVRAILREVSLDDRPLAGGVYWSFYLREGEALPDVLSPGRQVSMTARVYHPQGVTNPEGYDFREALLQQRIPVGVYGRDDLTAQEPSFSLQGMAAAVRGGLTARLKEAMGEEAGGYAAAMLLGSRDQVTAGDREAFARLGIAHLLTVSGLHVGLIFAAVAAVLRRAGMSRRLRFAVTAVLLALYCLLTGMNPPVIRAAVLMLLWEYGALRRRPRVALHLLCAAWMGMLALSPTRLTSMSFQLTFGAMLGLGMVTPWLQERWQPAHRVTAKLWSGWCAAAGAQAGILLPELYWFQELPLLGLVLNAAVMLLAGAMMGLCWLTLLLLPLPPLASLAGSGAAMLLSVLVSGVRTLGSVQGITLWTARAGLLTAAGCGVLLLALSWYWPGRRRLPAVAAGLAAIALSVCPAPHTTTEYIQFSVGEADAALLWDESAAVAIDTGTSGDALADFLHAKRLGLDALVLTHLHWDHAGGVEALLERGIPVKSCYLPCGAAESVVDEKLLALLERLAQTGTELISLSRGDEITLPCGTLTALWPERGKIRPGQDANLYSLALLARVRRSTLLLTGDLDGRYELYAACPADVLKAAHHGSSGSTSAAMLEAVSPGLVLLSNGRAERVEALSGRCGEIPLMDTRTCGAIILHIENDGLTVEVMRQAGKDGHGS